MAESSLDKPGVREILHSSTLLNALTEQECEQLAASSRVVKADRGEVIWADGGEADFIGIAGTGFVKMVRGSASGTDATMELMGPGQVFGMMGAITGAGCPLSAVAVTDLWYLRIPKSVFLPIYERSTPLKDRLIRRATVRLHASVDMAARMSSGRVDQRVAAILFMLCESYGERRGTTIALRVPLTRQEIAEMAGTTVESTIRTMSRWQKDGLVRTYQQQITIVDEPGLSKVLGG